MVHNFSISDLEAKLGSKEESLNLVWRQFINRFPEDSDCLRELYKIEAACDMQFCPECKSTNTEIQHNNRRLKCLSCNKITWLTAGTFFNRIRRAKPWLAAIWLLGHGVNISVARFHKLVGIAYSTAFVIFKKLTIVIYNNMEKEYETLSSALFSNLFCKRSRETPAKAHPVEEEAAAIETQNHQLFTHTNTEHKTEQELLLSAASEFEEEEELKKHSPDKTLEHQSPAKNEDPSNTLSDKEKLVYDCLSDEPLHFDTICSRTSLSAGDLAATLTILEFSDLIKTLPGGRYIRLTLSAPPTATSNPDYLPDSRLKTAVLNFMDFVRYYFQGISRKYLQNYLSAYWCYQSRDYWQPDSLLKACWQSHSITYAEILEYISPKLIKMMV